MAATGDSHADAETRMIAGKTDTRRRWSFAGLAFALVLAAGCGGRGSSMPPTYPVTGTVKFKDIIESIEQAIDRLEDVANTIEGIVLKQG